MCRKCRSKVKARRVVWNKFKTYLVIWILSIVFATLFSLWVGLSAKREETMKTAVPLMVGAVGLIGILAKQIAEAELAREDRKMAFREKVFAQICASATDMVRAARPGTPKDPKSKEDAPQSKEDLFIKWTKAVAKLHVISDLELISAVQNIQLYFLSDGRWPRNCDEPGPQKISKLFVEMASAMKRELGHTDFDFEAYYEQQRNFTCDVLTIKGENDARKLKEQ